jgi:hypothetical protein
MQTHLLEITRQAQDLFVLPDVTYDCDALLTHYRDYRVAIVVHDRHLALVAYRGSGGNSPDMYNRAEIRGDSVKPGADIEWCRGPGGRPDRWMM